VSASPNLEIHMHDEPGVSCIRLVGVIDEKFDTNRILSKVDALTILELSGIRRITSFGVRQWTEAMKALPTTVKHLYLLRCPPVFVDQLSMVLNFGGRAEVISAFATCVCEKCGDENLALFDFVGDRAAIAAGQLPESACPKCKTATQLADDPHTYVRLVNDFGAKSVDPAAASLLERLGLHALRKTGRAPEATKLVHDQITLFRLTGTLDGRFKQRRLASGVEGDVIFDLAEIEGLDAQGAVRWRELLAELGSAVSITLVDVPDVLLPAIADGTFAVNGVGVYSYQAIFQCADCGTVQARPLKADEPLSAAARPCARCGRTALPATDPALVEQVFKHARPAVVSPAIEAMIRDRQEILQRARAESGAVAQSSAVAGDSLARYRVIKPLSEGGMAEIFLAVHQGIAGFEKLVVLKKILRKMLERRQVAVQLFLNEAKIAANLNHPNIVQTFEVGEHGGDLFIAMEYIHGVDVRRLLRQSILKQGDLPLEQMLYVVERVAAALHHAHTAKDLSGRQLSVVHRDVSPSNIIVGFDGQVKLLDFGVASAAVGESFDGLIGKFSYMSPEQLAREPLDGRSDVFALGVVLFEILARRPLFRRDTDHETIRAVLHDDIPKLAPRVPDFVDAIIAKALARKRDERYPDARAFQVAVDECIRKLGNMPTSDQVAQTLSKLFPEGREAPAFDPSLYRSSGSELPSPTPSYRSASASSAKEPPSNPSKDNDLTLVNPDGGMPQPPVPSTARPTPLARRRASTFPPVPSGNIAQQPTPFGEDQHTAETAAEGLPEAVPERERRPSRSNIPGPLIPPSPSGRFELPPLTLPPASAKAGPPANTPGSPMPAPLSQSTPLPDALASANLERAKRRSSSDFWLIAAAVVIFIVGFLLVVL
jgi:eukaryotic-like serine/threonine-protein kinase